MRTNKTTEPVPIPPPDAQTMRNIWAKIKGPDECWDWVGAMNVSGYASSVSVDNSRARTGRTFYPHRLMFSWFKHQIPDDFTIDHLCKNRRCMNPDHMEAVTFAENVRRGVKRDYCKRGHPQIPENRYAYNCKGKRKERCKLCIPIQTEAWKRRKAKAI